ncbi:hypothetical protein Nepgr_004724 [Nepenthes gracilis]|uniref:Uncharacterized protein n=1 Tax=Nepenthes gracilis TaxID=150966 RepID=A0AAD3S1X4_NEPGR|nr:hypothetical protein Nepgr_004724 [Nepenthes gracilis]
MDVLRRQSKVSQEPAKHGPPLKPQRGASVVHVESPKASDALPLPLYLTNGVFLTLFFSVVYFLLQRWREKIRNSIPLHVVSLSEIAAIVTFVASFIYLLGFFGIDFVQSFIVRSSNDDVWGTSDDEGQGFVQQIQIMKDDKRDSIHPQKPKVVDDCRPTLDLTIDDEEIVNSVVSGSIPSYSLESKLGDCYRAAKIRREALQRITGTSICGASVGRI